jgi:hypothetical protein
MNEYDRAYNTMGESGISWVDTIFRYCVNFLVDMSNVIGISYEELNIWIFVIILPIILITSLVVNYILFQKLK